MKKIYILALFSFIAMDISAAINRDCLLEFQIAVASAQTQLEVDIIYCDGQPLPDKCTREANAAFQNSVYNAIVDYDGCTGT